MISLGLQIRFFCIKSVALGCVGDMKLATVLSMLLISPWIGTTASLAREIYNDRVVAIVNADFILASEIAKYRNPMMLKQLRDMSLGVVPIGNVPTDKEILDVLIVTRLLDQEAKKKGTVIDDKAVDAAIESVKTRERKPLTHDQLVLALAAQGIDYAEYRESIRRQMRMSRLIGTEVMAKVPLSEEDAQEFFKRNKGQIDQLWQEHLDRLKEPDQPPREPEFTVPTHETRYEGGQVRLRQIVLKVPQGAKPAEVEKVMARGRQIYQDVETGADFAQLAKKYSQDQSTASSGGDLGLMEYSKLNRNFQQLVQRLKVGQVTPPLKTGPTDITIFYLAEGKGRTEKQVPIPENVRKELEKRYKEQLKKRASQRPPQRPRAEPKDPEEMQDEPKTARNPSRPDTKANRSLGILSPEEEKEYEKVRAKVITLVQSKRRQARVKEWVEELKKYSIIEIKL